MSQILDLVDSWAEAELLGRVDAYDHLLSPDFTGIGPVGYVLTRRQWADRHQNGLTNHRFEVLDRQVRRYGDTAIVTGVQEQDTIARGHDASGSFRIALVVVRRNDRWEIAHLQLSGPLRAATAPPPLPQAEKRSGTISRDDLQRAMEAGAVTVVDALPAPAHQHRHLPGALNLTAEAAAKSAGEVLPDRTAPIVAYSTNTACTRGPDLVAELGRLGYQDVRLYPQGIDDWAAAGLPLVGA